MRIHDFIRKNPSLIWYTKNYKHLSQEAIVEAVLNYGDWDDVKILFSILGIKKVGKIFREQLKHRRVNYRPEIRNYFSLYFKKNA